MEGLDYSTAEELTTYFVSGNDQGECSSISITLREDQRLEVDEILYVNIVNTDPDNPVVRISQGRFSLSILDNDRKSICVCICTDFVSFLSLKPSTGVLPGLYTVHTETTYQKHKSTGCHK